MTVTIPNLLARRHLLHLNGLAGGWAGAGAPAERLDRAIARLGYVQVDSINTLERAHHHILRTRLGNYRHAQLARGVEIRRSAFENWTHDASIIPSAFFPYWRHRFMREKVRLAARWGRSFGSDFQRDLDRVLDHVATNGPSMARHFDGERPRTGWWDWHPSKAALEYLWRTGELAITRREGFQKVYDLTSRVIPAEHRADDVDDDAFVDWACRAALERLGFATRGEIAGFFNLLSPAEVGDWIARNQAELVKVTLEGKGDEPPRAAIALPSALEGVDALAPVEDRVRILSPFDPLLRDRARTERLFGFHYRIEVFVPQAQRRYGYYVFPVLRGETLVGRIDVKCERQDGTLAVRAFWPERGVRVSRALLRRLESELERMRRFSAMERLSFEDGWLREPL